MKLPSVVHGWLVEPIGHIGAVIPDRDSISSSKLEILGMYCPFMWDKVKLPSVAHGWLVELIGHIGAVIPDRDSISSSKLEILGMYCPFMRDKVKLPSVVDGWLVESGILRRSVDWSKSAVRRMQYGKSSG
ncbi:hypothetical protein P4U09_03065 [Bacillus smithii]|uniref:hypothetical protein n=1 Tax=Bacillus smithii TaxID=1479 RepID=UPI002E1AF62C|nr:hypothetical protein [Bacillus smithii]